MGVCAQSVRLYVNVYVNYVGDLADDWVAFQTKHKQ